MPATPTPDRPLFWVVCPDYAAGPATTREHAEHRLANIDAFGACRFKGEHEILPGDREGPRRAWVKETPR
jgi:hypothetical protein